MSLSVYNPCNDGNSYLDCLDEIFCADDIHKQKCCAKSHPVYVDWMNMTLFECPSESITDYNNVEYCKSDIDDNICCSRKKNKFTGSIDTILTPCTEDVYASFAESRPENSSDYGSHVWQGNASDIVEGEICFSAPDDKLCCSGKKGYFKNTIKHRCKDVVNIPDGHLPPSIKNDFEDNPAAWNKQESSTTETKYCYCDITHEECCTTNHESFKSWVIADKVSTAFNTSFRCSSLLTTTTAVTTTTTPSIPYTEPWAKPIPTGALFIMSGVYLLGLLVCCLSILRLTKRRKNPVEGSFARGNLYQSDRILFNTI